MFISACEVDDCLICDTDVAVCDECKPGFMGSNTLICIGNSHTYCDIHSDTRTHRFN